MVVCERRLIPINQEEYAITISYEWNGNTNIQKLHPRKMEHWDYYPEKAHCGDHVVAAGYYIICSECAHKGGMVW